VPLSIQCFGGAILAIGSFITPESPRYVLSLDKEARLITRNRYLIDTDQEVEGLAVIADFQGLPLDDPSVQEEYKEIRDAVLADVRVDGQCKILTTNLHSERSEIVLILLFGDATKQGC
jgi:hypothetical protein